MRRLAAALIAASSLATAACFSLDQTLTIEKDMAGTAGVSMKLDLEPMVGFVALMMRSVTGKSGAPTAEELAEARKELLESVKESPASNFEKEKKELADKLPAGVRLLDATFKEDGLTLAAHLRFGFDQASKLRDIKLDPQGAAPGPMGNNPMGSPFLGLQVIDEGRTLLVTSPARNPIADQKTQLDQMPPLDAAMKSQLELMLQGLRVGFRITAPFEVVEHNANRKEGNTLVWEYDMTSLEKLQKIAADQGVRVRYRK